MSKIDKRALREAAEKATPGNWWIDSHGQAMVSFVGNDVLEVFTTDNKRAAVRHEDTGNLSRWRNDNDATFIATADPATVLALLDELEAAEKRIAELESQLPHPSPVVTDKMTPEMMRAVQLNSELGAYAASNLSGAYDLFSEFWKVACRAAMLQCSEPVTDNTNQQFESLSRGDK